jgi:hypothetical protein
VSDLEKHSDKCNGLQVCENCHGGGVYSVIEGDDYEEREYVCGPCDGKGITDCYGCDDGDTWPRPPAPTPPPPQLPAGPTSTPKRIARQLQRAFRR